MAFQIKATTQAAKDVWYVSRRQVDYWRDHGLPVFVVLVDLSSAEMYLHRVAIDNVYEQTKKGAVRSILISRRIASPKIALR
ncbi:hypothetical protein AWV79_20285 [Cupriavidus sp. UYMMa02A]|nr:hypothetical protein AWV79_20285 [Cupriavidus sp. UYMMa02A]